jgi:hypothetical protein
MREILPHRLARTYGARGVEMKESVKAKTE